MGPVRRNAAPLLPLNGTATPRLTVPAFSNLEPFLGNDWGSKAKSSVRNCSNSLTEWRVTDQHSASVLALFSLPEVTVCEDVPTLHIFSSWYPAVVRKDYIDLPCLPTLTDKAVRGDMACPGSCENIGRKTKSMCQALHCTGLYCLKIYTDSQSCVLCKGLFCPFWQWVGTSKYVPFKVL